MIGRVCLYTGLALIAAAALRATVDLFRSEPFNPWAAVLAAGCVLSSIGVGLTGSQPWKRIEDASKRFGAQRPNQGS